tara:strand:+ start:2671 stop:2931 length:261 start_codon:yes stop_codon:yes gene_type:complete
MKNRFLIIGLAMGSLSFSQNVVDSTSNLVSSISIDSVQFKPRTPDFKVDSTTKVLSVVCGKNTSKNIPCKNKTRHESGSCHHHRED